jgi:LytS/YehU family sensor histidine kinase
MTTSHIAFLNQSSYLLIYFSGILWDICLSLVVVLSIFLCMGFLLFEINLLFLIQKKGGKRRLLDIHAYFSMFIKLSEWVQLIGIRDETYRL